MNHGQKRFYDLTAEPEAHDQNQDMDHLLVLEERISYLTDLIEHALGLEYLIRRP